MQQEQSFCTGRRVEGFLVLGHPRALSSDLDQEKQRRIGAFEPGPGRDRGAGALFGGNC